MSKERIDRTPVFTEAIFANTNRKRDAALIKIVQPSYADELSIG